MPKRADSFGNEAYSTKIMEFMSQSIPVVVSRTKVDSYYFDEETVRFFPSGDSTAMADAMYEVATNTELRESMIRRGLEYVEINGWNHNKQEYFDLIDGLSTQQFGDLDLKQRTYSGGRTLNAPFPSFLRSRSEYGARSFCTYEFFPGDTFSGT